MNEKITEIKKPRRKLKKTGFGRPRNTVRNRKDRSGRPVKIEKTNKKRGPARFVLPFEEARTIVRGECLGSHNDFIRWWNMNIPARIPKNPARTYVNEGWVSWGDWTGTYNTFPDSKKIYRSFHDARDYARSLKLKTREAWVELGRQDKLPTNIPLWPNLVYGKTIYTGKPKRGGFWVSWKDWIGSSISDQLIAIKNKLNILVIARNADMPSNIYMFMVMNEFESDLRLKLQQSNNQIIKLYHISPDFDWGDLLSRKFQSYYDTPGLYVISNINEVLYYFDMHMEKMTFTA
jgi:hypothetical protein